MERWPKPVPEECLQCLSRQLLGTGPCGHWDSEDRGGLLYEATCQDCGSRLIGYGFGSPDNLQILKWERQRGRD
jgi:hypothetical protein